MTEVKNETKKNSEPEDDTLLPTLTAEQNFDFFQVIESIIISTIAFVRRFFYTSYICFHPNKLLDTISRSSPPSNVIKPFTFLAIYAYLTIFGFYQFDVTIDLKSAVKGIESFSASKTLTILFVPLAYIYLLAIVWALFITNNVSKKETRAILYLNCYVLSACKILLVISLSVYTFSNDNILNRSILFVFQILIHPIPVFLTLPCLIWILVWKKIRPLESKPVIFLSPFVLTYVAGFLPLVLSEEYLSDLISPQEISLSCNVSKQHFDKNKGRKGYILTILLNNTGVHPIFIPRRPVMIKLSSKTIISPDDQRLELYDWQEANRPILDISPGQTKWAQYSFQPGKHFIVGNSPHPPRINVISIIFQEDRVYELRCAPQMPSFISFDVTASHLGDNPNKKSDQIDIEPN